MKKLNFLSGLILGAVLFGGTTAVAASGVIANITSQIFFWNDTPVKLDAYNINGSNYIKLRDVAALFNADIIYDGETNSVYINTKAVNEQDEPMETPEANQPVIETENPEQENVQTAPTQKPEIIDGTPYSKEDYSLSANPEIFNDTYTKDAYNALRQSLVDIEEITADTDEYGYNENYVYAHFIAADSDFATVGKTETAVKSAAARIAGYYDFTFGWEPFIRNLSDYPGYRICRPYIRDTLEPANEATESFIQNLNGLTDKEKIKKIATYVSVSIVYKDDEVAGLNEVFTSTTPVNGICGTYSSAFTYLCQRAGIPCLSILDSTHAWNEFYIDGRWYVSDIGYYDITRTDDMLFRTSYSRIDPNPELTQFIKELLVPGSTK